MPEAGSLVVATFNIRNGLALDGRNAWPLRRKSTLSSIRGLDADVVGLQEVFPWQLTYLRRGLDGYEAHGEGRSPGRQGEACPVLLRSSRLRVEDARTRWFGPEPDRPGQRLPGASYPRIATLVNAADPTAGDTFRVVNTHLDEHRPENRRAATAQLLGWLPPGEPLILLGDLNTTEDDDGVFSLVRDAGLGPVLPPDAGGTAHGFRGTGGRRIDHILVSPHWEVVEAEIVTVAPGRRLPSDHWPVRSVLRRRS
ncbi:MAG: endonuclease/exonuclease/phosphatase family protein [Acidimicrobiia bacterium]